LAQLQVDVRPNLARKKLQEVNTGSKYFEFIWRYNAIAGSAHTGNGGALPTIHDLEDKAGIVHPTLAAKHVPWSDMAGSLCFWFFLRGMSFIFFNFALKYLMPVTGIVA
jgi:hypothetical protein